MDDDRRCTAKSQQSGQRCKRAAVPGTHVCSMHGGKIPQVQAAAERRLLEAETARQVGELLEELAPDAEDVDGVTGLIEVLRRTWAMRRMLELCVAELTSAPGGGGLVGPDHLGDGRPHALVNLLGEWTDRHAKVSKMAIDAGLDERRVKAEERQVEAVAQLVMAALSELGVPMDQAAPVVARHLRALPAA